METVHAQSTKGRTRSVTIDGSKALPIALGCAGAAAIVGAAIAIKRRKKK